jgi:hypothetical protein
MADFVFVASRGRIVEKIADQNGKLGIMLLKTAEADVDLRTRSTLDAILSASNIEANFTNYSRKTNLTATITTDNANNRVDVSIPNQTWALAGGTTNNTVVKAIIFYEESASDAGRIPLTAHDFVATTDGTDLTITFSTSGFYRSSG